MRAVGCWCPDLGALQASAESDGCDANLIRVTSPERRCARRERVVPRIERVAAARSSPTRRAAIRYACCQTAVHALVIGMVSQA